MPTPLQFLRHCLNDHTVLLAIAPAIAHQDHCFWSCEQVYQAYAQWSGHSFTKDLLSKLKQASAKTPIRNCHAAGQWGFLFPPVTPLRPPPATVSRPSVYSCTSHLPPLTSGPITVYCSNLSAALCHHINAADSLVGCVAWLTHRPIIAALTQKPGKVQLVVDSDCTPGSSKRSRAERRRQLQQLYSTITPPITCVGDTSKQHMHHKFLVFSDNRSQPYAVWTGSFNFTGNGAKSLENAVYLADPAIAAYYYTIWQTIHNLSRPLFPQ